MLRARIIPSLLIDENGNCIQTKNFNQRIYVGDILNNVRIFNEKQADELVIFDIDASKKKKEPNFKILKKISYVCRMPLCYGGGINSLDQVKKIISYGVEKISISSNIKDTELISEISKVIGSQSNVVCANIKIIDKKYYVINYSTNKILWDDIKLFLDDMNNCGVGEIIFNFIDKDGTMNGYDISFLKHYMKYIKVPFTILGGAGSKNHLKELININPTIGAACGSFFTFKGAKNAILLNYLNSEEKKQLINKFD